MGLDGDDGVDNDLHFAILVGRLDLNLHTLLAVNLESIDDLAAAGDDVSEVRNTSEAGVELAQLPLITVSKIGDDVRGDESKHSA